MKFSKKLTNAIEAAGFSIYHEDENYYRFGKYSSKGQDFSFYIDTEGDMSSFMYNILNYYDNFDVSEETYYWLDNTGHGKNGAPYDMKDVYEDMEECQGFIYELYEIVREFC
jgi:hypothetical protein